MYIRSWPFCRVFILPTLLALVVLACLAFSSMASASSGDIALVIDGKTISSDAVPRIVSGRTLVPIRVISESLGWDVEWLAHKRQVLILGGEREADDFVLLTVGDPKALVNGEERAIDPENPVAPMIVPPGRVMVPVRFVAEAFGSDVDWDGVERTVLITSPRPVETVPDGQGGSGHDADKVQGIVATDHGVHVAISGRFSWRLEEDGNGVLAIRLMGTDIGSDVPMAKQFPDGPVSALQLRVDENPGGVLVDLRMREDLAHRIEATEEGLDICWARLEDVSLEYGAAGPLIRLTTNIPVDPRSFVLEEPARAVIDFPGAALRKDLLSADLSAGILEGVRFGRHREGAGDIFSGTRVVLDLTEYRVPVITKAETGDGFEIVVRLQESSLVGKRIVIDPGHGGADTGAIGSGGVTEKEIVLEISRRVIAALESEGATVISTRKCDYWVEVYDRPTIANSAGADAFVSVHANADPRGQAEGTETFHYPNHDDSRRLADTLHHQIVNMLGSNDRGVRYGNFAVLREAAMPAVLLECLYLSSPREQARLQSVAVQEAIAQAVVSGLKQFFAN